MAAEPRPGIDPSSFVALVTGLGAQCHVVLGVIQNPITGRRETPDLGKARVLIGTLEMLREKTEGHRTEVENEFIRRILADARIRLAEAEELA